jgi:hypothetical protein
MRALLEAFELPAWSRAACVGVLCLCAEMFAPAPSLTIFRVPLLIASLLAARRERNALWFAQVVLEVAGSVRAEGWGPTTSTYAWTVTTIDWFRLGSWLQAMHVFR